MKIRMNIWERDMEEYEIEVRVSVTRFVYLMAVVYIYICKVVLLLKYIVART